MLLSNVTASQAVHEAYGGVVPELASRAHQQNVVPVVHEAIKRAGITKEQLSAVAFTRGPGLMGSLLVGVSFAKGFARSLGIPLIDVNHLQGHVMAHFILSGSEECGVRSENTPAASTTLQGNLTPHSSLPTPQDDDFDLSDLSVKPKEKTREDIIAEAEAAAFAEG